MFLGRTLYQFHGILSQTRIFKCIIVRNTIYKFIIILMCLIIETTVQHKFCTYVNLILQQGLNFYHGLKQSGTVSGVSFAAILLTCPTQSIICVFHICITMYVCKGLYVRLMFSPNSIKRWLRYVYVVTSLLAFQMLLFSCFLTESVRVGVCACVQCKVNVCVCACVSVMCNCDQSIWQEN